MKMFNASVALGYFLVLFLFFFVGHPQILLWSLPKRRRKECSSKKCQRFHEVCLGLWTMKVFIGCWFEQQCKNFSCVINTMLQEISLQTVLVGLNLQETSQSTLGFIKNREKHYTIEYLSWDCQHPCWDSSCDNFVYILGQTMLAYI